MPTKEIYGDEYDKALRIASHNMSTTYSAFLDCLVLNFINTYTKA